MDDDSRVLLGLLPHRDAAYLLALRITGNSPDAEDAVQEGYLRAVRFTGVIRPAPESRAWLLRIVANAARDLRTSQRTRRMGEGAFSRDSAQRRAAEAQSQPEREALCEQVGAALAELDEDLRLPVSLHYVQGLPYAEAAKVLNVPEGTLRVYASRGLHALREKLVRAGYSITPAALAAALAAGGRIAAPASLAQALKDIARAAGSYRPALRAGAARRRTNSSSAAAIAVLLALFAAGALSYAMLSATARTRAVTLASSTQEKLPSVQASDTTETAPPNSASLLTTTDAPVKAVTAASAEDAAATPNPGQRANPVTAAPAPRAGSDEMVIGLRRDAVQPAPAPVSSREMNVYVEASLAQFPPPLPRAPLPESAPKIMLAMCGGVSIPGPFTAEQKKAAKDSARAFISQAVELELSRHPEASALTKQALRNTVHDDVWLKKIADGAEKAAIQLRAAHSAPRPTQSELENVVCDAFFEVDEKFVKLFIADPIETALTKNAKGK